MINDNEKNQLLNTIEILTREHRAMSETLTAAVDKATQQQNTIRAFRRLTKEVLEAHDRDLPEAHPLYATLREVSVLVDATKSGHLPPYRDLNLTRALLAEEKLERLQEQILQDARKGAALARR